jgi:tRNA G10  N-methylase Trm11
MKTYFSTFISGTQEIVKEFLVKHGQRIKLLLDGLVVYQSDYSQYKIKNFRIFNNTFLLLKFFYNIKPSIKSLEKILLILAHNKNLIYQTKTNLPPEKRDFKIITSLENKMVSVDRKLLKKLESVILKIPGMRLNIKKPNLEFWVLLRREKYGFFGLRITYPSKNESRREKGELRKEVAYVMNFISNPDPKDIVLDPFAGHGAIPLERARNFPYKRIIAIDKDSYLVYKLKRKVATFKKNIEVICGDALNLYKIPDKSIDKIITDPPWGEFEKIQNLEKFYEAMLREFDRVLKSDGIIVLLIGAKGIFENLLQSKFAKTFCLKRKYDILVSGKKAAIYQIIRSHGDK